MYPSHPLPLEKKLQQLKAHLSQLPSVLVAFSGGVDSSFLLAVAASVLPKKTTALMTISSTTPPDDERQAIHLAEMLRIPLLRIAHDELAIPQYAANPHNRCYFCKESLYTICHREAQRLSLACIVDGVNLDDLGDYRPGIQAATEHGIFHPLVEAGFTKIDIRQASRHLGLPMWDRPASPCLSSRIPYGNSITAGMLKQIAQGEAIVRAYGFREVRLRHHREIARIEVAKEELQCCAQPKEMKTMGKEIRTLGFRLVGLDLAGYKTGVFNDKAFATSLEESIGRTTAKQGFEESC